MSSHSLSHYLQKNTEKKRATFYLCCLGSLILSAFQTAILYSNTNEFLNQPKLENKEKKLSLFHVIFPLTSTILSFFLTFETFKNLKKLHTNKKREISVSKDVLNQLYYINPSQNKTPSIYDPLTEKDIKNLVKTIDFSPLEKPIQQSVLQNLITVSHSSPFVAKILKSELRTASIHIDPNLHCGGIANFSPYIDTEGKVTIQDHYNVLAIAHEFFHLKQAQDGAFCLKKLHHYVHLINEAQAKGLNYVLNFAINEECKKLNLSNTDLMDWENTLYYSQFEKVKQTHPTLNERELQGKAEEKSIGVLMKCLLEDDEKKREEIFKSECASFTSIEDKLKFHDYCFDWRTRYIDEAVLKWEKDIKSTLKHIPETIQSEVDLIPEFNDYFSYETGIQQDIKNIKIAAHDKNNALFQFTHKGLEKE